jgi:hypothetical protein
LVAQVLQGRGVATLLLELLTSEEQVIDGQTREYRFDIDRLGRRVVAGIDWTATQPIVAGLPIGRHPNSDSSDQPRRFLERQRLQRALRRTPVRNGVIRAHACMSVDFPDPDGPVSEMNAPASTSRATPRRA